MVPKNHRKSQIPYGRQIFTKNFLVVSFFCENLLTTWILRKTAIFCIMQFSQKCSICDFPHGTQNSCQIFQKFPKFQKFSPKFAHPPRFSEIRPFFAPANFPKMCDFRENGGGTQFFAKISEIFRKFSIFRPKFAHPLDFSKIGHFLHPRIFPKCAIFAKMGGVRIFLPKFSEIFEKSQNFRKNLHPTQNFQG